MTGCGGVGIFIAAPLTVQRDVKPVLAAPLPSSRVWTSHLMSLFFVSLWINDTM